MTIDEISRTAKELMLGHGYDLVGICEVLPFERLEKGLSDRIVQFPLSEKLYLDLQRNICPTQKASWAKSIIVCARNYGKFSIPDNLIGFFGRYYLCETGLPYAEHRRNDTAIQEALQTLGLQTERMEIAARSAAERAGVGRFGRNNFIYTEFGSWISIDTWLVDQPLLYDLPLEGDPCVPGCRRCIDACPTEALAAPYSMNMGKCIPHLISSQSTLIDASLLEKMGTWLYGCDACQVCCPQNRAKWNPIKDFPGLSNISSNFSLSYIFLNSESFAREMASKFGFIHENEAWKWQCGAIRAMAAEGSVKYLDLLENAKNVNDDRVNYCIRWAVEKIKAQTSISALTN